jgi:hypothetical protein
MMTAEQSDFEITGTEILVVLDAMLGQYYPDINAESVILWWLLCPAAEA